MARKQPKAETPGDAAQAILALFPVGSTYIARRLGTSPTNVRQWPTKGIPCRWHGAVLALAQELRVKGITREALERASRDVSFLPPLTEENAIPEWAILRGRRAGP